MPGAAQQPVFGEPNAPAQRGQPVQPGSSVSLVPIVAEIGAEADLQPKTVLEECSARPDLGDGAGARNGVAFIEPFDCLIEVAREITPVLEALGMCSVIMTRIGD